MGLQPTTAFDMSGAPPLPSALDAKTVSILDRLFRVVMAVVLLQGCWPTAVNAQALAPSVAPGALAPHLDAAPNGVPVVAIRAPNAEGVSHNQYQDFNVGQQGLILNNSPAIVSTQLAGYIGANQNLKASGPARLILNEVTSANRSVLNGYLEVAGQAAQVVVANPNGITCAGCGFINTPYATLSTGTPRLGPGGALTGYAVGGGDLVIEGAGLDARGQSRIDLITRAMTLNAGVWANDLNVAYGAGEVSADDLAITNVSPVTVRPVFGLDVAAIGGMYANSIRLVGTEAGLGVRIDGDLASLERSFTLTSGGAIQLNARVVSAGDVTLSGASVASKALIASGVTTGGVLTSGGDINVQAAGEITLADQTLANGDARISGGSVHLSGGELQGRSLAITTSTGDLDAVGATLVTPGAFDIAIRGSLLNANSVIQGAKLSLRANALDNASGLILQTGVDQMRLGVAGQVANAKGTIASVGGLVFEGGQVDNGAGLLQAERGFDLSATAIKNGGGQIVTLGTAPLTIVARDQLDNRGGLIGGGGDVAATAGSIDTGGTGGRIVASGDLSVTATQGDVSLVGGLLSAGAAAKIQAKGMVDASQGGVLQSLSHTDLTTGVLKLDGGALVAGSFAIKVDTLSNLGGKISQTGAGEASITATGLLDNTRGVITAKGSSLGVTAGSFVNAGGVVSQAGGALNFDIAGAFDNNQGVVESVGTLRIKAASLVNRVGLISAAGAGSLALNIVGRLDNREGQIASQGDVTISAGLIDNSGAGARIVAKGALGLTATSGDIDTSRGGLISAGAGATLQASGALDLSGGGTFQSGGLAKITSDTVINDNGQLTAGGLDLTARTVSNRDGNIHLTDGSSTVVTSDLFDNSGGNLVVGAGDLLLTTPVLDNTNGLIAHTGSGRIAFEVEQSLINNHGRIASNGDLGLATQQLQNVGGRISAVRDADVRFLGDFTSGDLQLTVGKTLNLTVSGAFNNNGSTFEAAGGFNLSAAAVNNAAGKIIAGGTQGLTIHAAGAVNNHGGVIASNGDVEIDAASVDTSGGGAIAGQGDVLIAATNGDVIVGAGSIAGAGQVTVQADRNLTLGAGGKVQSGGKVTIAADGLDNRQGQITGSAFDIATNTLDNRGGQIQASGQAEASQLSAGNLFDNRGGEVRANGSALMIGGASVNNAGGALLMTGVGQLGLDAATLNNQNGQVASNGALALTAGQVDNTGGRLTAVGAGQLRLSGPLANAGGVIATGAALGLETAGVIDNAAGLLQAGGGLSLVAGSIQNAAGKIVSINADGLSLDVASALVGAGQIGGGGNVSVTASAIDVSGGGKITAQGDLSLETLAGDMSARDALLAAGGHIVANAAGRVDLSAGGRLQAGGLADVTAATLKVDGGVLTGQGLRVAVGQLSNRGGSILASGASGDASFAVTGAFDNTGGTLSANGTSLSITADSLTNNGGTIGHAGAGLLTLGIAHDLNNGTGAVATNGALDLTAATLQSGGRITSVGDLELAVSANTRNAGVLASGRAATLIFGGALDNTGGQIEADALTLTAASIVNANGRVVSTGSAAFNFTSSGAISSQNGLIGSGGDLVLNAASLDVSGANGRLVAAGDMALTAATGAISAANGGTIGAGGALNLSATQINASTGGLIQTTGAAKLVSEQLTLDGNGQLLAGGLDITADTISNLGGKIAQSGVGDLVLTATTRIDNTGGAILANAANLTLTAPTFVNSGGLVQHAGAGVFNVDIAAIIDGGGAMRTNGDFRLDAVAVTGGLDVLALGDVTISTANGLDLSHGGAVAGGALDLSVGGTLINSDGLVQSGRGLTITADAISNLGGQIITTGTSALTLTSTNAIDSRGGEIGGGGDVNLNATAIDVGGAGGRLVAGGDLLAIASSGAISAAGGGVIGSNGEITLRALSEVNAGNGGLIQSTGLATIDAPRLVLDNGGGLSALQLLLSGDTISNRGGQLTQTGTADLLISTIKIDNTGGQIATNALNVTIDSPDFINTGGKILHAGAGDFRFTSAGTLSSTGGQIATQGTLTLTGAALDLAGTKLSAAGDATLSASSGAIDLRGGGVASGGLVTLATPGAILNTGGVLAGATGLRLTSASVGNAGGKLVAYGGSGLDLNAASLDNSGGGLVGAAGAARLATANLNNSGGTVSADLVTLSGLSNFSNAGGTLQTGGSFALTVAGTFSNAGGVISADSGLTLNVGTLNNASGTLAARSGVVDLDVAGTLTNTGGRIGGALVSIDASQLENSSGTIAAQGGLSLGVGGTITNNSGVISAGSNLTLTSASLSNVSGRIGAGGDLRLISSYVSNAGGQIAADRDADIDITGLSGGGVAAGRNLYLDLAGGGLSIGAGSTLSAGSLLSLSAGSLTNSGSVQAQTANLTIGGSVFNADGASMQASSLTIGAGGTIENRGLINGSGVTLTAGEVINRGSLFGSTVDIRSSTFTNTAASGGAAVVAARSSLNIGASSLLQNTYGATLFSLGSINLGGTYGGSTSHFVNFSSTVSAYGSISIAAALTHNSRPDFVMGGTSTSVGAIEYTQDAGCTFTVEDLNCARVWAQNTSVTTTGSSSGARSTISAGGNITFSGGSVVNYASTISAGGNVSGAIDNVSVAIGTVTTRRAVLDRGTVNCDHAAAAATCSGGSTNGVTTAPNGFGFGGNVLPWISGAGAGSGYIAPDKGDRQYDEKIYTTYDPNGMAVVSAGGVLSSTSISNATINPDGSPAVIATVNAGPKAALGAAASTAVGAASGPGADTDVDGRAVNSVNQASAASAQNSPTASGAAGTVNAASSGSSASTAVSGQTTIATQTAAGGAAGPQAAQVSLTAPDAVSADGGGYKSTSFASGAGVSGATRVSATSGGRAISAAPGRFKLPANGMAGLSKNPSSGYLVETNPAFTNYQRFLSSDYYFDKLGLDPRMLEKRLGDALYEQQLIAEQIAAQRGGSMLAGYTDVEAQFRALMDAGVAYMQSAQVAVGVSLSAEQMASLTTDMVLMVETVVDTPSGPQTVLAPVVYLAQGSTRDLTSSGGLIAANDIDIRMSGALNNNGTIQAANSAKIAAADITNIGKIDLGKIGELTAANDLANLGQITGQTVNLSAGRDLFNAGVVTGGQVSLAAANDLINFGQVGGGAVSLSAGRDLLNAGSIGGGLVGLSAGGVLANAGLVVGDTVALKGGDLLLGQGWVAANDLGLSAGGDLSLSNLLSQNVSFTSSLAVAAGGNLAVDMDMSVKGALSLTAAKDLTATGATLNAGTNLALVAGQDLTLTAVQGSAGGALVAAAGRDLNLSSQEVRSASAAGATTTTSIANAVTTLTAGGDALLQAGGDLVSQGAKVAAAGQLDARAGGDVVLASVTDTTTTETTINGKKHSEHSLSIDETVVGSSFSGGQGVSIAAGLTDKTAGLLVSGSEVVSDKGAVTLTGAGGVAIAAAYETDYSLDDTTDVKKKLLSKKTTKTHEEELASNAVGSLVSGATVSIGSGGDLSVIGSQVLADNGLKLLAEGDVTIAEAQNSYDSAYAQSVKKSGFSVSLSGGLNIFAGVSKSAQTADETGTTALASVVGSVGGDVTIGAGHDVGISGSQLAAAGDLSITGQNVTIDPSQSTSLLVTTSKQSQTGLTLKLTNNVISAVSTAVETAQKVEGTDDSRLQGVLALSGARSVAEDLTGKNLITGDDAGKQGSAVQASLSFGSSSASSKSTTETLTNTGSALNAGGAMTVIATGDGSAGSGDLSVLGSSLKAGGDVTLAAAGDLLLASARDTRDFEQSNKASGASIGVGITGDEKGLKGGVTLAANASKGSVSQQTTSQVETTVSAGQTLLLKAQGDATLKGATAAGQTVLANIGGDLSLISEQDTDAYRAKTSSVGGSLTVGPSGPTGGSFNLASSKTSSDYASVTTQTGIAAGAGGFDLVVGGKTDLQGAAISSTAAADRNSLTTATLSFSDLNNAASYDAKSGGIGLGYGPNGGKLTPNLGVPVSGDAASTTVSSIAQAAIQLTNPNGQTQDLATLDRSAAGQANALKAIFDSKSVADQQQLGQVFAQEAFRAVGDVSEKMIAPYKEAAKHQLGVQTEYDAASPEGKIALQAKLDAANAAVAAEQATYDLWKDGGAAKVALHAAVGASISGLTGGSVAGGALSAGASEAAAPLTAGQTQLVQELASTVIGAAGAAIGGGSATAGGAAALAGQQYNRELHPDELAALNKAKEGKTPEEQQALNNAACLAIQCWITGTADGANRPESNYNATIRDQVEAWAKANPEAFAAASATLGATGLFVSTPGEVGRDAIIQARVDYHGGQAAHLAAEKGMSQSYLGDLDMQLTGRALVTPGQFWGDSAKLYASDWVNGAQSLAAGASNEWSLLRTQGLAGYVSGKTAGVLPSASDWVNSPVDSLAQVVALPAKTLWNAGAASVDGAVQYTVNLSTIPTDFYYGTATPRTGANAIGVGGDVALAWAGGAGLKALQGAVGGARVAGVVSFGDRVAEAGGISTAEGVVYNGLTGPGPLGRDVAETFRSATYIQKVTEADTILYRAYGGKAGELSPYWSRIAPSGPLQATLDSALLPEWGNTAQSVSRITVPRGTTIYEGAVAPQGDLILSLPGGGNQVYIPKVNPEWLMLH